MEYPPFGTGNKFCYKSDESHLYYKNKNRVRHGK